MKRIIRRVEDAQPTARRVYWQKGGKVVSTDGESFLKAWKGEEAVPSTRRRPELVKDYQQLALL